MDLRAAFAASAVLVGAAAPTYAATRSGDDARTAAQYQHDLDGLGVLARLQGKDIRAADVLPPSTPIPHFFGAPGTDKARRDLLELTMGVR